MPFFKPYRRKPSFILSRRIGRHILISKLVRKKNTKTSSSVCGFESVEYESEKGQIEGEAWVN